MYILHIYTIKYSLSIFIHNIDIGNEWHRIASIYFRGLTIRPSVAHNRRGRSLSQEMYPKNGRERYVLCTVFILVMVNCCGVRREKRMLTVDSGYLMKI